MDTPFLDQADLFAENLFGRFASTETPPATIPLTPILIEDVDSLSQVELDAIRDEYYSERGVVSFILKRVPDASAHVHPLVKLTDQLAETLDLKYAITHPKEFASAPDDTTRTRGVVRIYDQGMGGLATSTNSEFVLHQDGLGSTGAVRTVALYADAAPFAGGYSCFQNLARVAMELFVLDQEAYRGLFLPDAITIIRPTGSRAIRVTGPALYFDAEGLARVNFVGVSPAHPGADYATEWRSNASVRRGLQFMLERSTPFASGSTFCHLGRPGSGIIFDNTSLVHGRTGFIDAPDLGIRRIVSRRWFASSKQTAGYRHAPGLRISPELAGYRPDLFGSDLLEGEWRYSLDKGCNVRVS